MLSLERVMVEAPVLRAGDEYSQALKEMADSGRDSIAVIDDAGKYVGMVSDNGGDAAGTTCADEAEYAEPMKSADAPTVLLRLFAESDRDSVAVIDDSCSLVGIADRRETLRMMAEAAGADSPGATVSVTMRAVDYEIGRLATVIEMSGAKIVSLLTTSEADRVSILIKIAQQDPYPVMETLDRHGYEAVTYVSSYSMPQSQDILRHNYDSLINYLQAGARQESDTKRNHITISK